MVNLSLAGLVSQESGEDWTQAALTLSTAIPSGGGEGAAALHLEDWHRRSLHPHAVAGAGADRAAAARAPAARAHAPRRTLLRGQIREVAGVGRPRSSPAQAPWAAATTARARRVRHPGGGKRQAAPPRARPPAPAPPPPAARPRAPAATRRRPGRDADAHGGEGGVDFDGDEVEGELAQPRGDGQPSAPTRAAASARNRPSPRCPSPRRPPGARPATAPTHR